MKQRWNELDELNERERNQMKEEARRETQAEWAGDGSAATGKRGFGINAAFSRLSCLLHSALPPIPPQLQESSTLLQ